MAQSNVLTADPPSSGSAVPVIAPLSGTTSVDLITDLAAFVRMESDWNETVQRAGITHPFLRHEWLRTWWECFGASRHLHIVVVRSSGRIQAIAPLMWETVWMYGMRIRRLRLLHNDHTPRADIIVAENPKESYREVWRALHDTSERWDVLQLGQLPQDSPTLSALPTLAAANGYGMNIWQSCNSPYLTLNQTWDEYFEGVGAKFKQNLRNRMSRLTHLGRPALEILDGNASIAEARDEALRLEASGWKRTEGTAICSIPAIQRFYNLLAERASESGWLRLLFLTVDGRRIATAFSTCYQNRLSFLKTGYDPEYAKCSPFKILTYLALRDSFATRLTEVDFLGDAESWKLEWTNTTRHHQWLYIFADTCRARLLHPLKFQLVPALKRRYD